MPKTSAVKSPDSKKVLYEPQSSSEKYCCVGELSIQTNLWSELTAQHQTGGLRDYAEPHRLGHPLL